MSNTVPMLDWKDRIGYIKQKDHPGGIHGHYSWLINEWIPNQPDADILMRLFIGMRFHPFLWLCVVRWKRNWIDKAAGIIEKKKAEEGA